MASVVKDTLDVYDRFKSAADAKKRRRLAVTLYLIYFRLNECIATGNQIFDTLEQFVSDPGCSYSEGKYRIALNSVTLEELLAGQVENLNRLHDCVVEYSAIIRALDSELFLRLEQFVAFKGVGLSWISILLRQGSIPIDALSLDDIERLASLSTYMLKDSEDAGPTTDPLQDTIKYFLPWYHEVGMISARIQENSFELAGLLNHDEPDFRKAVNSDQLQRLKSFLSRNDLRQTMDAAASDLKKIRSFIEENFSVVDLMLDVGSEQLRKKPII